MVMDQPVCHGGQSLSTAAKILSISHTASPTLGIQNPDSRLGQILTGNTTPTDTSFVQTQGQDSLTIIGNVAPKPDFDTCFGTLHIDIPNLHYDEIEVSMALGVKLEPLGSHLGIFDVQHGRYRGSVNPRFMASVQTLQREGTVRATFDLVFKPPTLHVTVYGCRTQSEHIGDFLAQRGLFLQAPQLHDKSVTYFNSQYLVPPGKTFSSTTQMDMDELHQMDPLNPNQKSIIMDILDESVQPPRISEVSISNKLKTTLKEYQRVAFAMMAEKERGSLVGNQFPSLWDEMDTSEYGGLEMYSNNVTGEHIIRRPALCLGGILADYHGQSKSKYKNEILDYDLVITTYETLRREVTDESKTKGQLRHVQWTRVVLDEAHVIRNRASKTFQAVTSLKAKHRWCLTGTPIQNHVQDLGSLVEFLQIDVFSDHKGFKTLIVDPISRNENEGFEKLRSLFQAIALRRTKESVMEELHLPLKSLKEEPVGLDAEERQLYDVVKNSGALFINRHQKHSVLQTLLKLRQIANHGRDLVPAELIQKMDRLGKGALVNLAADACEGCGVTIKQENAEQELASVVCMHQICTACSLTATESTLTGSKCPLCSDDFASISSKKKSRSRSQQAKEKLTGPYKPSSKVKALLRNLEADRTGNQQDDEMLQKSVVFSCWAGMLDLIERALDEAGIGHVRIDGAVSETSRRQALDKFRKSTLVTVLLATIGTAGVGLDLTAASRVHLMEPQWNPMVERQAIDRLFRLGQTRDVLAISYIMDGDDSVDKYIRQMQQRKLNVVHVCVDGTDGEGIAESASQWVESITNINQEKTGEEAADVDMIG
ncbi:hypothetical protein PG991_001270 [Apiospora marii]|uniref:Uncharacterized protein n=1 Tax=Apiospora marii TaxID=335849 RepID=A0ABR1SRK9_9PEZI